MTFLGVTNKISTALDKARITMGWLNLLFDLITWVEGNPNFIIDVYINLLYIVDGDWNCKMFEGKTVCILKRKMAIQSVW
jgi:hypothetical protein